MPLSGGADSASVAAIVGCMCQLALKAVQVSAVAHCLCCARCCFSLHVNMGLQKFKCAQVDCYVMSVM